MSTRKYPIIAIVGRPNVGKSTFFNRVLGKRQAIVEDEPGVTRDRLYALISRFSIPFILVDTGGFERNPQDDMVKRVVEQTMLAAEEADLVLAMFDGGSGLLEGDEDVMNMLRRYDKSKVYAVNKCDSADIAHRTADFYALGVDELFDVSALHNRNVDKLIETALAMLPGYAELLAAEKARLAREKAAQEIAREIVDEDEDDILEGDEEEEFEAAPALGAEPSIEEGPVQFAPVYLPDETEMSAEDYQRAFGRRAVGEISPVAVEEETEEVFGAEESEDFIPSYPIIRVAIVGRPNVGKSTLLNTLCGEQRAITSPIAGTTRDVLDVNVKRDGQDFLLLDTAGLRKKSRVDEKVEHYSALRSLGAIAECDVAVVLIDATEGPIEQDARIVGMAHEQGCALILAVNKWDLKEKDHRTVHKFTQDVREAFKFAPYAPIIFISALNGRRCPRVLDEAKKAAVERGKKIATGNLNRVLRNAMRRHTLPSYRGRPIKLFYGVQIDTAPPRFALYFNYPRELHFSSARYIKNVIRESFGFVGTDIKVHPKKR